MQRRVEEPSDARCGDRTDEPGQLGLRCAVDRPKRREGPDQLHVCGGLQAVNRGEMAHSTPGEGAGLIGVERELKLDGADGHGWSLPNGCSTCQIDPIVRTLAVDASVRIPL